ncbi:uncharacterized protein LOC143426525 [Xylocopa sonorina]|uniref:uncharacterized protein LOC143426525 n=1 Tax=Xylocopa sonorina TaxID=1818115 RepID=UPI00403B2C64
MYQICNDEDEFEPRITPKPAPKPDCLAIPSVPEVSLIFDKPLNYKGTQCTSFQSPSIESKSLIHKTITSSPLSANGSYAAWKERNYSCKPSSSKVNSYTTAEKIQFNQNYSRHPCSAESPSDIQHESKEGSYVRRRDIYKGLQCEQETYRRDYDCSNTHNFETLGNNTMHRENSQTVKVQNSNKIKHIGSVSSMPHASKPCINTDNYIISENEYSPRLYNRKLVTHNTNQQRIPCNDSATEPNVNNLPINPNALQRNEVQLPHYIGQQYPYFNMNAYPYPQVHHYATHNTDNQETLKNLLQIINSQNEQIKALQIQVDRLLNIQEKTLKEGKRCSCLFQSQQNDQLKTAVKSNDILDASNYVAVLENAKKNVYQREFSKDGRKESHNENGNQSDLILTDTQSKKAFVEEKVSIGVMTSFEFTVQSPFTVDVEDCERKNSQQNEENIRPCNNVGFRDTNESLRRYKNSFTRIPSAQLENIVEDSESYMSSSQQQSSNLNASTSTKDLEKQAYVDIRREIDTHKSESPKLRRNIITKLSEAEDSVKKHLEKTCTEEPRNYETVKTPMTQRNFVDIEYNVPQNKNVKNSSNISTSTDQFKKPIMERDNDSAKASSSANNSDYYKDYRKEGQLSRSKRTKCVEDSLILNGGDLHINERPPPTPEPSIHVDMHEYSSDDDSEKVKRSSKVGWTFYNNVLGQVNQLLQNSCIIDEQQQNKTKTNQNERDETENRAVLDTVKVATLEQLKKIGISLSENPEVKELNNSNKVAFDLSSYPRLDYQSNMTQATNAVNETNTSMHMKALALKYLTDEQLAELSVQRQSSASVKHLLVSNVQGTNMSFATMRYLERYQLLPGKNNVQTEDTGKVQSEMSPKIDLKLANSKNSPKPLRFPFNHRTTCPSKILDISTLKQQPKLL